MTYQTHSEDTFVSSILPLARERASDDPRLKERSVAIESNQYPPVEIVRDNISPEICSIRRHIHSDNPLSNIRLHPSPPPRPRRQDRRDLWRSLREWRRPRHSNSLCLRWRILHRPRRHPTHFPNPLNIKPQNRRSPSRPRRTPNSLWGRVADVFVLIPGV